MKKNFLSLILIASIACAFQHGETFIDIHDMRALGFNYSIDTATTGHYLGEVIINRVTGQGDGVNARHDSLDLYNVHFFKNYQGHLKNYLLLISDTTSYNQASYKWVTDSIVSVQLLNSKTKKQTKPIRLVQMGATAGIDNK